MADWFSIQETQRRTSSPGLCSSAARQFLAGQCRQIAEHLGKSLFGKVELLPVLGSKHGRGRIAARSKFARIRAVFGLTIPTGELSVDARMILRMWLSCAIDDDADVDEIIDALVQIPEVNRSSLD